MSWWMQCDAMVNVWSADARLTAYQEGVGVEGSISQCMKCLSRVNQRHQYHVSDAIGCSERN